MKSAELEQHAMECLVLAREVPDPRQRQLLRELGLSWLHFAEQVTQHEYGTAGAAHQASSTRLPNIQSPFSSSRSASNRA
jgi:hypothetical protein